MPEDSYTWDFRSRLYYHAPSGFYHDPVAGWSYSSHEPVAGWSYSSHERRYYRFEYDNYVPWESQPTLILEEPMPAMVESFPKPLSIMHEQPNKLDNILSQLTAHFKQTHFLLTTLSRTKPNTHFPNQGDQIQPPPKPTNNNPPPQTFHLHIFDGTNQPKPQLLTDAFAPPTKESTTNTTPPLGELDPPHLTVPRIKWATPTITIASPMAILNPVKPTMNFGPTITLTPIKGKPGRREWRPPWHAPCRHVETEPHATGRHEWRPPWRKHFVLEDKDDLKGRVLIRTLHEPPNIWSSARFVKFPCSHVLVV
ncbi:hypothetical protein HanIR_Chr05g0215131 [Helianthus annuus]|nr:hypothetical protein HanIR_Chr05g0215131 [Helianthus annuus]